MTEKLDNRKRKNGTRTTSIIRLILELVMLLITIFVIWKANKDSRLEFINKDLSLSLSGKVITFYDDNMIQGRDGKWHLVVQLQTPEDIKSMSEALANDARWFEAPISKDILEQLQFWEQKMSKEPNRWWEDLSKRLATASSSESTEYLWIFLPRRSMMFDEGEMAVRFSFALYYIPENTLFYYEFAL